MILPGSETGGVGKLRVATLEADLSFAACCPILLTNSKCDKVKWRVKKKGTEETQNRFGDFNVHKKINEVDCLK